MSLRTWVWQLCIQNLINFISLKITLLHVCTYQTLVFDLCGWPISWLIHHVIFLFRISLEIKAFVPKNKGFSYLKLMWTTHFLQKMYNQVLEIVPQIPTGLNSRDWTWRPVPLICACPVLCSDCASSPCNQMKNSFNDETKSDCRHDQSLEVNTTEDFWYYMWSQYVCCVFKLSNSSLQLVPSHVLTSKVLLRWQLLCCSCSGTRGSSYGQQELCCRNRSQRFKQEKERNCWACPAAGRQDHKCECKASQWRKWVDKKDTWKIVPTCVEIKYIIWIYVTLLDS